MLGIVCVNWFPIKKIIIHRKNAIKTKCFAIPTMHN